MRVFASRKNDKHGNELKLTVNSSTRENESEFKKNWVNGYEKTMALILSILMRVCELYKKFKKLQLLAQKNFKIVINYLRILISQQSEFFFILILC